MKFGIISLPKTKTIDNSKVFILGRNAPANLSFEIYIIACLSLVIEK